MLNHTFALPEGTLELRLSQVREGDHAVKRVEAQVDKWATAIAKFGFNVPILVNEANRIVWGVELYWAAQKMGLETVPVVRANHLTPQMADAFSLAAYRIQKDQEWDDAKLHAMVQELDSYLANDPQDWTLADLGFTTDELAEALERDLPGEGDGEGDGEKDGLEDWEVVPSSVLDANKQYWRDRRNLWVAAGLEPDLDTGVMPDPVLLEFCLLNYGKALGSTLEANCGPAVGGVVFALHGQDYTGVDEREPVVKANRALAKRLEKLSVIRPNASSRWAVAKHSVATWCEALSHSYDLILHRPRATSTPDELQEECYRLAESLGQGCFLVCIPERGVHWETLWEGYAAAHATLHDELVFVPSWASVKATEGEWEGQRVAPRAHQPVYVFLKGSVESAVGGLGVVSRVPIVPTPKPK